MKDITIQPSKKLRTLVSLFNSVNACSLAWGIPYTTFSQWWEGKGSLPGNAIATIIEKTGLPYETLFEHVEEARR